MRLAEQRELMGSAKESIGTSPISNIDDDDGESDDKSVWLVDQRCTLADLSFLTWAKVVDRLGIDLEAEYPEVNKWISGMLERPEVQSALVGSSLDETTQ
jgi:glutathione S-transferase